MICFTCDLDWASDAVLADTLQLFSDVGIPCTLFATHATPLLRNPGFSVEVALHPNFNPLLEGTGDTTACAVVQSLQAHYPEALGVRSHSLTSSSRLSGMFREQGMVYEANTFLPYATGLHPVPLWNGLLRIPFNWEDDVHALFGRPFDQVGLDLSKGLNILNFHPIHIFLNTESILRYEAARPCLSNPSDLLAMRNRTGTPGVRDLLLTLLGEVQAQGHQTLRLIDLAQCPDPAHLGDGNQMSADGGSPEATRHD